MPSMTINAAATLVVNANAGRRTITFTNLSVGSQVLYLSNTLPDGLTTTNAGYPMYPGEKLIFMVPFDGEDVRLPWSAIASAAGGVLYYQEMFERAGPVGGGL